MKRILLSALIGVGVVALILPLFAESSAAWTPESHMVVCRVQMITGETLLGGTLPG